MADLTAAVLVYTLPCSCQLPEITEQLASQAMLHIMQVASANNGRVYTSGIVKYRREQLSLGLASR